MRVVERTIMIKEYPVNKLTEGDWLAEDVKLGKKLLVSKSTTGLSLDQIKMLKESKVRAVKVREGIAFVPGFLLAFAAMLFLEWQFGGYWLLQLLGF